MLDSLGQIPRFYNTKNINAVGTFHCVWNLGFIEKVAVLDEKLKMAGQIVVSQSDAVSWQLVEIFTCIRFKNVTFDKFAQIIRTLRDSSINKASTESLGICSDWAFYNTQSETLLFCSEMFGEVFMICQDAGWVWGFWRNALRLCDTEVIVLLLRPTLEEKPPSDPSALSARAISFSTQSPGRSCCLVENVFFLEM